MAANGISTLVTKELRQKAKLDLAATNRATDGNLRATYDLTQLPTQYDDNAVVNNPNIGGLVQGRPWIETVSTFTFYEAFGTTTAISTTQYVSGNKIYAESSTYDVPDYQPARVVVNDIQVANTELRGHTLVVLDTYGDVVTGPTHYDTYIDPATLTTLASALYAVATGNIVVLVSYDASALNAAVRTVIDAGYDSSNSNTWTANRTSQIFIGIRNEETSPPEAPAPSYITENLVLHLDAGNATSYSGSGTTWTDLSGNSRNATLTSVTYTADNGGALVFDGANSIGVINDTVINRYTNNFSVEVWYTSNNNTPRVLRTGQGSSGFNLGSYTTVPTKWKVTKYGIIDLNVGSIPQNTAWHQVVLVYSSTGGTKVYVDGALSETNANTAGVRAAAWTYLEVGRSEAGSHNGKLGIVRYYNAVLSDADVSQNFNANKSRYGL
jgi:hypothetical protein